MCIAGEHHRMLHAAGLERGHHFLRVGFEHVAQHNVAGVMSVHGHVDYGSGCAAVAVFQPEAFHELFIAHSDLAAVDEGRDSVARKFLNITDPAMVDVLAVGLAESLAYGVRRGAFGNCGKLGEQALFLLVRFHMVVNVVHGGHFEHSEREGSGFVHHHRAHLGEVLQDIGALNQDAFAAGPAYSGEERERDAYHERTRAAYHQEGEGPVDPLVPERVEPRDEQPHQRRQQRKRQGGSHDCGRVDAGEAGDEVFRARLVRGAVFHQLKYLGNCGLPEFGRGAKGMHAGKVNAAAEHGIAYPDVARKGFAREGGCVQRRRSGQHHGVDRHFLAWQHGYSLADLHLVGVHPLQGTVFQGDVGVVGTYVHERADAAAAAAHGVALEELPYLVEKHHGDGLQIVAAAFI